MAHRSPVLCGSFRNVLGPAIPTQARDMPEGCGVCGVKSDAAGTARRGAARRGSASQAGHGVARRGQARRGSAWHGW